MSLPWKLISFCAFVLMFVRGCQGKKRGIDFHLDDQAVPTWPGGNLSVLCDVTSYSNETHLTVLWQDVTGRTIGSKPGRVFAIRYNRGFMNRLVLLQVSDDTAGTYVCTVMRNAEILDHKHITVYLLGRRFTWDPVYPENIDHRRGDLPVETGLDYRPVRSAERRKNNRLARSATIFLPDGLRNLFPWSRVDRLGKLTDRRNYKAGRARVFPYYNSVRDNNRHSDTRNIQQESTTTIDTKKGDLTLTKRIQDKDIPLSEVMLKSEEMKSKKHQISDLNPNQISISIYSGDISEQAGKNRVRESLSRNKRQGRKHTTQSDTETSDSSGLTAQSSVSVGSGEGEISTSGTQEEQSSLETQSTNTSHRKVTVTPTIGKQEITTQKIKINSDTSATNLVQSTATNEEFIKDQDDPPVTSICSQTSNFGKYGIMALSVTLAVVVLLLYAIGMIVFMPRILARRRLKAESGITGNATYKKTDPDNAEFATVQIVDVGGASDSAKDSEQNKADEAQQQLVSEKENNEKTAPAPGQGDTTNVSSFLLHQGSQKKDDVDKKLASDDKKGETTPSLEAAPDTPRQAPGTDTQLEPSRTPELNPSPQNLPQPNFIQEPENNPQPPSDFLSSLVPEMSLSESIRLADQNQLFQTANASAGSTLATSFGEDTLKQPSTPGSDDLDLLPPPPPIQDCSNVSTQ